jgi:hypothetical protein
MMENYAATLPDATGNFHFQPGVAAFGRKPHSSFFPEAMRHLPPSFRRGEFHLCFYDLPHLFSSPQGEDMPKCGFRWVEDHPPNSVARHFKHAAKVSPSPSVFASLRRDCKSEPRRSAA